MTADVLGFQDKVAVWGVEVVDEETRGRELQAVSPIVAAPNNSKREMYLKRSEASVIVKDDK